MPLLLLLILITPSASGDGITLLQTSYFSLQHISNDLNHLIVLVAKSPRALSLCYPISCVEESFLADLSTVVMFLF